MKKNGSCEDFSEKVWPIRVGDSGECSDKQFLRLDRKPKRIQCAQQVGQGQETVCSTNKELLGLVNVS